jgi:hypothetical protein
MASEINNNLTNLLSKDFIELLEKIPEIPNEKIITLAPQVHKCEKCTNQPRYRADRFKGHDISYFLCDYSYTRQKLECCKCNKRVPDLHGDKSRLCSYCRRVFCYPKCISGCAGCGDEYCDECSKMHSCHGC